MKTTKVTDVCYENLLATAQKNGTGSVFAHIENSSDIQMIRKKQAETKLLEIVEEKKPKLQQLSINERLRMVVCLIYQIDPTAFETKLEGFTKPEGRAIFISRFAEKIAKTSESAKPRELDKTGFYLNIQVGEKDSLLLIELICKELGFSPAVSPSLKRAICSQKLDLSLLEAL